MTQKINNKFKKTEIGEIHEGWEVKQFSEAVSDDMFDIKESEPKSFYKAEGKYPVIDQGKELISGYTNDDRKVYKDCLPIIVFGDHTRVFKFIDFPFVTGADGVKLIKANENIFIPKFLYYAFTNLNIPNRGYNRHFKILKEQFLACPPKSEQEKIANLLSRIQGLVENQEKLIERLKELKSSTMSKLFTEGLYNKKRKKTEIGEIPEDWEVKQLQEVCDTATGGTPSRSNKEYFKGNIPWVKSGELEDKTIFDTEEKISEEALNNSSAKIFPKESVLIALYGATVGKTGFLGIEAATNQAICGIFPKDNLISPKYLQYYLIKNRDLLLRSRYGGAQPNISQQIIRSFLIAFPPKSEQEKIAEISDRISKEEEIAQKKLEQYKELFSAMLNQLMTGKIRLV